MEQEPLPENIIVSKRHPDYVTVMTDEEKFEKRKAPLEAKFKEVILPYVETHPQLEQNDDEEKVRYVFCGSAVNLLTALSPKKN